MGFPSGAFLYSILVCIYKFYILYIWTTNSTWWCARVGGFGIDSLNCRWLRCCSPNPRHVGIYTNTMYIYVKMCKWAICDDNRSAHACGGCQCVCAAGGCDGVIWLCAVRVIVLWWRVWDAVSLAVLGLPKSWYTYIYIFAKVFSPRCHELRAHTSFIGLPRNEKEFQRVFFHILYINIDCRAECAHIWWWGCLVAADDIWYLMKLYDGIAFIADAKINGESLYANFCGTLAARASDQSGWFDVNY